MSEESFVVILAGGSGTRFWPLSRDARPKQLLDLFDGETLIAKTVQRLEGLVPRENILILTNELQKEGVRAAVPDLPDENILSEPAKRDTAPAVALGVGWVARKNPNAVMAVLPADHLIQDEAEFRRVLQGALDIARASEKIVTLGVKPTWACPGYGYIERGAAAESLVTSSGVVPHDVVRFREKPSVEEAEEYLQRGVFSWNAGMFIWAVDPVREELKRHAPELAAFIDEVVGTPDLEALLASDYATLPKISIDYALMEKVEGSYNVEATFDWDDVGSWLSVAKYLEKDDSGNRHRASLSGLEAEENVVFSATDQHVALLGVSNLIVVQTKDALLIADRSSADEIKALVERVPDELR